MKANRLMKLVTVAIAAALFLGPVPTAMATPSSADARLAGRVFDKDLVTPAASLTVAATSLGAKAPAASSRTDKDGRFELAALPAGYYDLLISDAKGQPLATARVMAKAGEKTTVTMALPDRKPGESAAAPAAGEGFLSTPTGKVTVIVGAAIILAVAANSLVKDNSSSPVSPNVPQ